MAVGLPVFKTFHYKIPEKFQKSVEAGKRVFVPFGGRKVTGYVLSLLEETATENIKEILDVLDDTPLFSPRMIPFFQWIANYYLAPLGEVLKTALPTGINVGTRQKIVLTEKGKGFMKFLSQSDFRLEILQKLAAGSVRSKAQFIEKYRNRSPHHLLNLWKKEEIIEFSHKLNKSQIRPRKIKIVHFLDEPKAEDNKISPKQKTIFARVKEKKKIPLSFLRKEFGDISSPVKRLLGKGFITVEEEEANRSPQKFDDFADQKEHELTREQKNALSRIFEGIASESYLAYLLYGVTGSGKTEVYLRAIKEVLSGGKGAIVLTPEISLTPQLVDRFRSHFGDKIAILHSGISLGERYDEWRRIKKGEAKIVIGARSAIFAPLDKIGIIIVDEEHEPSYKQDDRFKYHARDIALVRGKFAGSVVILGSATPSVESYYNTSKNKLIRLDLPRRVEDRPMPRVKIVDMKKESKKKGKPLIFSRDLAEAIRINLEEKNQIMLFLNRRGFATFLLCPDCGFTFRCPNCSVTLTHHLSTEKLHCHYCGYVLPASPVCPGCQGSRVNLFGLGTERLEEEIKELFPQARVGRMDRDSTTQKNSHHKILKSLRKGDIDLLVGTQMIAKGHDFPGVTLVGVISADLSLNVPDFRASERTFQLLTQVAGRAGRGNLPGEVIIQTYNPDYFSIICAKNHDFSEFFKQESYLRKEFNYPPFSYLTNFRLTGNSEKSTKKASLDFGNFCRNQVGRRNLEILGPIPSPLAKIKGKYRWQILLKAPSRELLHNFTKKLLDNLSGKLIPKTVDLSVDVDPRNML